MHIKISDRDSLIIEQSCSNYYSKNKKNIEAYKYS